jgi:tetratricopeptide (TPR) repeat protein
VQEYAAERLGASGGRAEAEGRHGAVYGAYGTDEAMDALDRSGGVERRRALAVELDNVVVACRRAVARGDGEVAAAALRAAWAVLELQGPLQVAVDLATTVLRLPALPPGTRAGASTVLGGALDASGRGAEARAHYDAALAVHREVGNRRGEGIVLGSLGVLHADQGRMDEARACFGAGEALLRQVGDPASLGIHLCGRARMERAEGRVEAARATLAEAAALALQVHAGPDSELGRALALARAAVEGS